jgi:hypothetical protein
MIECLPMYLKLPETASSRKSLAWVLRTVMTYRSDLLSHNAEARARLIFSVRPTAANATACFQIPSSRNNNHDDS